MTIKDLYDDAEIQGVLQGAISENQPEGFEQFKMEDVSDTDIVSVNSDSVEGTCTIDMTDNEGDDISLNSKYKITIDSHNEVTDVMFDIDLE